jgi:hypothetical protein
MCGLDRRGIGKRIAVMTAAIAAALSVAGCESPERFRLESLRGKQNLVGGGTKINWQAPEAGTVYLVEQTTGKLMQTQSLERGGVYHFAIESVVDAADMEDLLGIDIDDAEFLLYFEPAGSTESTS